MKQRGVIERRLHCGGVMVIATGAMHVVWQLVLSSLALSTFKAHTTALVSPRWLTARTFPAGSGLRSEQHGYVSNALSGPVRQRVQGIQMEASVDPSALNALLEQIAARFAEFSHRSSEGSALQPMLMLGSETDASSFGWDQLMSSLPAEVQDAILQSAASLSAAGSTVDWTSAGIISGAALAGALSYSDSAQADQKKPLPPESTPYPTGRYDPEAAAEYFRARPLRVAQRVAFCARPVSWYLVCLLVDWLRGEETLRANMRARAEQLVEALNELGPTCIKVGQALSIRADLIPLPYIEALAGLQDNVPAFPNVQARQLIAEELQLSDSTGGVDRLFRSLSSTPVAAASLGQVYRGVLKDGREVAVKVQRPDVLEPISLDLYLLRSLAKPFKESRNLNTDIVGLVDDWGRGFVDELDYTREAANSESFLRSIAKTPLASVVTAPEVVGELSTKRVLTTLWVNGARLELSAEDDVARLCGVALNAYLTMLLETGLLHCDPHPGNLLRTADGRLCILDWGLVTTLEPELQLRFLEHVAHLTAKDYAAVPADLVALGFVPANMEEAATSEGVVEALTDVYSQWAGGGGASKIDVSEVTGKLQALTEEKGNFFQIPPYFAYVLRAFSVLEGIALMNDPDYSVLNACLPYISQRVLSDPSPRSTNALRSFVYTNAPTAARAHRIGDAPPHRAPQVIDSKRFLRLFDGLQSFAASSGGLDADKEQQLETLAVQIVDLLFSAKGSPVQDLLLFEAARLIDATVRDSLHRALSAPPPPLRRVLLPALDPFGLLRASSPLLRKYDEDEAVLTAARELLQPLSEALQRELAHVRERGVSASMLLADEESVNGKLPRLVAAELWRRRAEIPVVSARLSARVLMRGIDRVDAVAAADVEADREIQANGDALGPSPLTQFAVALARWNLVTLSSGLVALSPLASSNSSALVEAER